MNETADVVSNLPTLILLSFWWAFLSMLDILSWQGQPPHEADTARPADEAEPAQDDFPQLREADPHFSAAAFLQGACRAYEEILDAYASCDAKALEFLLAADVLGAFTQACDARAARGETLELTFIGMESAEIVEVEIRADAIEIAVLFKAELVEAERSATGEVIGGNPAQVKVAADLWTFSRPQPAVTPNWVVVATGGRCDA